VRQIADRAGSGSRETPRGRVIAAVPGPQDRLLFADQPAPLVIDEVGAFSV